MRIGVPVAHYHQGTTGDYVIRALQRLGHEACRLSVSEFYDNLKNETFEFFFCVDSGEPISFLEQQIRKESLNRVAYWFIDFRHHRDGETRTPGDLENARVLNQQGGWIFQAQHEDYEDCVREGMTHVRWLPLAADPEIWQAGPLVEKRYDLGFVGNVWDRPRAQVLELLLTTPWLHFAFKGHGGAWMEEGACVLRQCKMGFNISSFYGSRFAFDVNMRVFETLSCGIPLITNAVASLNRIFPPTASFIRTYEKPNDILPIIQRSLADHNFLNSGAMAREFIVKQATYEQRMRQALEIINDH